MKNTCEILMNLLIDHYRLAITSILFFLAIIAIIWSQFFYSNSLGRDLLINISAGLIGAIFTFLFIDKISELHVEKKWRESKQTAKDDLSIFSNKLSSYMASPLGFTVSSVQIDPNNLENSSFKLIKELVKDIASKKLSSYTAGMDTNGWKRLQINLFSLKEDLDSYILIYKDLLPPDVFSKFIKIRKSFKSLSFSFNLLPDLFIYPPSQWPPNNGGLTGQTQTRSAILQSLTKEWEEYFQNCSDLIAALTKWRDN